MVTMEILVLRVFGTSLSNILNLKIIQIYVYHKFIQNFFFKFHFQILQIYYQLSGVSSFQRVHLLLNCTEIYHDSSLFPFNWKKYKLWLENNSNFYQRQPALSFPDLYSQKFDSFFSPMIRGFLSFSN